MTDKQTEALKLALEALESCSAGDYSTGHVIPPSFDVDSVNNAIEAINALAEQPAQQHPDDIAIDRCAEAMKAKMAKQRAKGYGGWDDPEACPTERLQQMLVDHIAKGDPVDVANFAMMLWNRGERTEQPAHEPVCDDDVCVDCGMEHCECGEKDD